MIAVVMNKASTRPLMNRNAARGLSSSRRPAMRLEGPLARPVHQPRSCRREPRAGDDEPDDEQDEPREQLEQLPAVAARFPRGIEVGKKGDSREERNEPVHPWRSGCGVSTDAERRALDPPQREARRQDRGERDAADHEHQVRAAQREVARCERRAGERNVEQEWLEGEEQAKASNDTDERRDDRLNGGDHGNLSRRGADETHRGEALFTPCRRQPSCGGDQDQHRQQNETAPPARTHCSTGPLPTPLWQL